MSLPMRGFCVVLLLVLLGCAGGATSKPESATAPGVDIATYQSFGWPSAAADATTSDAPLSILDANLHDAIRTQLIRKGYSEVEAEPDFRIHFETATILEEKRSNPVRIGIGVGSWGGHVGGGVGTSVPIGPEGVVSDQKTRLTIRAVDPRRNQEVWVGTTTEDIGAGAVEKAVADALADFPARRR